MYVTVAEVIRPVGQFLPGCGLFGQIDDYVHLLAAKHYDDKKPQVISGFKEKYGLAGLLLHRSELSKEQEMLKDQCITLAFDQVFYILKLTGLKAVPLKERDELALPEERKEEAPAILEDFVKRMNTLLRRNEVVPNFRASLLYSDSEDYMLC
jgi:hypothetical protein